MTNAICERLIRTIRRESLVVAFARAPTSMSAFEVGYDTPSAFTAMFHRVFGI
jgi:AraC-like DNA-binding protein